MENGCNRVGIQHSGHANVWCIIISNIFPRSWKSYQNCRWTEQQQRRNIGCRSWVDMYMFQICFFGALYFGAILWKFLRPDLVIQACSTLHGTPVPTNGIKISFYSSFTNLGDFRFKIQTWALPFQNLKSNETSLQRLKRQLANPPSGTTPQE